MIPARAQIQKILEYQTELVRRDFEERRGAIYADHSAKGCLQSGSTIRAVVRPTVDWHKRESARAWMRVLVKRILKRYGYPPDLADEAVQTVLQQAELLLRDSTAH